MNRPPSISSKSFACPSCGVLAQQDWYIVQVGGSLRNAPGVMDSDTQPEILSPSKLSHNVTHISVVEASHLTKCHACSKLAFWIADKIFYPPTKAGAAPNPDLPDDIKYDYEEARAILQQSPRSAAALLRLCLEKLCRALGQSGKIDNMLADLIGQGVFPKDFLAGDLIRIIGNEAVHPISIDLKEDRESVELLFDFINLICEKTLSLKKKEAHLMSKIAPSKLAAIATRNAQAIQKAAAQNPPSTTP